MTLTEAIAAIDNSIKILENPDLTDALEHVRDDYTAQVQHSFTASVDPDGEAWEPVHYREMPPPTLVLTGTLRDATIADAQGAAINKTTMETAGALPIHWSAMENGGNRTVYVGWAARHGAKLNYHWINSWAARPFLGFGEATLDKAVDHGVNDLNEQLLGVW